MAKLPANQTRIWLNAFDLSGALNSFQHDLKQEVPSVDVLNSQGPERVVGNYDYSLSTNGFFDGDEGAFDEQAFSLLGVNTDHLLSLLLGYAEGSVGARMGLVHLSEQPRSGQLGGAVLLNLNAEGSGGLSRGVVLANAIVTGAGNRTGRNLGATSGGKVFAVHFHLFAFTGTNITLKVQESSDDGGSDAYADITGLSSGALTAVGAVRKTTSANTEAYKRVAVSGTFTSATIGVVAGVVAGT